MEGEPPSCHGGIHQVFTAVVMHNAVSDLSHPQQDASDAEYSQFIENIGDGEVAAPIV